MRQKNSNSQQIKHNAEGRLALVAVAMGLSFMADLYVIVKMPSLIWLIGLISLVFLSCVYIFVRSLLKEYRIKSEKQAELYEELCKSSKANYLMAKKQFEQLTNDFDSLEKKAAVPAGEIIEAQKGIAKITISRNKENADALLNSNDKLLDKILEYEDLLKEFEESMISRQKELLAFSMEDISSKQQELTDLVESLISSGSTPASPTMFSQEITEPVEDSSSLEKSMISDEDLEKMIAQTDTPALEEEDINAGVISFDNQSNEEEESPDIPIFDEEPIPDVFEEISEETLPVEEAPEEAAEAEEEKPPMPDLSDPNKMMSPEDIAALLANLT